MSFSLASDAHHAAVAFDGTSATALLLDRVSGRHLAAPKLYNEAQQPAAVAAAQVVDVQLH
jgi:hypothetical protein